MCESTPTADYATTLCRSHSTSAPSLSSLRYSRTCMKVREMCQPGRASIQLIATGNLEYRLVSALSAAAFFGAHTLSKSLSDCGRSCASIARVCSACNRCSSFEPAALLSIPSALTLSVILLLLSPILQTLSKATTSDSIWPLAGALLFVNAILADYSASEASTTGCVSRSYRLAQV